MRAEAATANLGDGDILVADRAYTDLGFMNALALRHVFFVLLLRFLKFLAKWKLSFSRLAGVVRASVWVRRKVVQLLEMYGTAGGWKSDVPRPKPLYLQGAIRAR